MVAALANSDCSCELRSAVSSSLAYWQPAHGNTRVVSATINN